MQAVLNEINHDSAQEEVMTLLNKLEGADANTKNDIENSIVKAGAKVVDFLVSKLTTLKGMSRGTVAMSLIRIGDSAIEPLREKARERSEFGWMADYLISEINGTY